MQTAFATAAASATDISVRVAPPPTIPSAVAPRGRHLAVLEWAFALFSSLRVLAYLPTLWAIHSSGDSSQHSIWTWLIWLAANATMAAWLYEREGRRINKAVLVSACNGAMCLAVVGLILSCRFSLA